VFRDKNGADTEFLGDFASVQSAAAAEGDQGEVTGIVSALDRDQANGALHIRVRDAQDTFGGCDAL
jgi:hypothetical protein